MHILQKAVRKIAAPLLTTALLFVLFACAVVAQQATGSLRGRLTDQNGAVIPGATVTALDSNAVEKSVTTNAEGAYVLNGLARGRYTVRALAEGFALYENSAVDVASRTLALDISLGVTIAEESVTVAAAAVSTEPENNAGAIVLRGAELDALPDDPDELADALQALAGPSAGPNGGQIYIDGFTGGRLPPRESIREIRVNQNPFSSEFDRLGSGRIEILTKSGTDRWRGQAEIEFEDEALNSRNSYAPNRAPFQLRNYEGNLSGSLIPGKASFFLDLQRRDSDENALINARILDPALNITPFNLAVLTPRRSTTFSPRFDYALNATNTLVGRYTYSSSNSLNSGIGEFDLLSRAFNRSSTEHTVQLTETAVINSTIVNETRFQYARNRNTQEGDNAVPTIRVLDAFTGGGAGVGFGFNNEDRYELQNYTSFARGTHALKVGARLRNTRLADSSPNNFGGTFTFTSLDQYRGTLLGQDGARPAQFTIAGGNPLAEISQNDLGIFLQDDWRVRPDLTLSLGLRYETQTNINSNLNFAPRLGFAWSPGAASGGTAQTVIRGGFGIFYDRFSENLSLQAVRFNGENQQQFIVTDPNLLDSIEFTRAGGVLNAPSVNSLTAFAQPQTTRLVAPDLQAPYTMQSAIGIERRLPFNSTISATFLNARTLHVLRSRNINAPLPGTFIAGVRGSGIRPDPTIGNIFQYESSGRFNQNQLILNLRSQFSPRVSIFSYYAFGKSNSDADGAGSFAANQYDFTGEYGRSTLDVRHRFVIGSSISAPWNVRLSPFVIASSGRPFNITIGRDLNGDTLFTERPAFATDPNEPGVIATRFGLLDPTPSAGQAIIPRNFGDGPSYFVANLRMSKTFGFGNSRGGNAVAAGGTSSGSGGDSGRGSGRRGGDGGGIFGGSGRRSSRDGSTEKPYNLTFTFNVRNIFNHTNPGLPVGNLSSTLFDQSLSSASSFGFGRDGGGSQAAGNRRVELELRFSF